MPARLKLIRSAADGSTDALAWQRKEEEGSLPHSTSEKPFAKYRSSASPTKQVSYLYIRILEALPAHVLGSGVFKQPREAQRSHLSELSCSLVKQWPRNQEHPRLDSRKIHTCKIYFAEAERYLCQYLLLE
jgi:hypothetical protein